MIGHFKATFLSAEAPKGVDSAELGPFRLVAVKLLVGLESCPFQNSLRLLGTQHGPLGLQQGLSQINDSP